MEFHEHMIFGFIAIGVGLVIGLILLYIKLYKDQMNTPDEETKQRLLAHIKMMREQNAPYKDRLTYLQEQGLRKDVADAILGEDIRNN